MAPDTFLRLFEGRAFAMGNDELEVVIPDVLDAALFDVLCGWESLTILGAVMRFTSNASMTCWYSEPKMSWKVLSS